MSWLQDPPSELLGPPTAKEILLSRGKTLHLYPVLAWLLLT
ncbi:hypothetical protein NC652_008632 [Populus alba x Populus x berolinensis]|nr:hypothetical protein NC652_008632 [Populus alba x Populus x berolinensis]